MQTNQVKATSDLINIDTIKSIVRESALATFGIKEIANIISKKGKKEDGIVISERKDKTFALDVFVLVSSDVKITEALRSAQKAIRYKLNRKYQKRFPVVNVYCNGVF